VRVLGRFKNVSVSIKNIRVRIVLEKNLLEWASLRDGKVYFTIGFAKEIEEKIGDVGGLKGLAELLESSNSFTRSLPLHR